jgi:hypothetical protein
MSSKANARGGSPNASFIAAQYHETLRKSEQDGINDLERFLLFGGEVDGPDGVPMLSRKSKPNFSRDYLPKAQTDGEWSLSAPQPDTSIGYIRLRETRARSFKAPFTLPAEAKFMHTALTPEQSFPFLTTQWKSQRNGESHEHAKLQSARDGAAIVNYLHCFYSTAKHKADVVQTSHVSLTCDLDSVKMWIHWREEDDKTVSYKMELIDQAFLNDTDSVRRIRRHLHNLVDYCMQERLASIKSALADLMKKGAKSKEDVSDDDSATVASASEDGPTSKKRKI